MKIIFLKFICFGFFFCSSPGASANSSCSEIFPLLQYQKIRWRQNERRPDRAMEIRQEITQADRELVALSVEKGGEAGVIEAFDASGKRIDQSEMFLGERQGIPSEVSVPPLVQLLARLSENPGRVAAIRFTHTHLDRHRGMRKYLSDPQFFSVDDLESCAKMHEVFLNGWLEGEYPFLKQVALEVAVVHQRSHVTLGEIFEWPSGTTKSIFQRMRRKPVIFKSTAVFLNDE